MPEPKLAITEFILDYTLAEIPAHAMHMARRCLLDTLGVWAAGNGTDPSRIARQHAAQRYPGSLPLPFDGRLVNPIGYAFAGAASIDAVDGHDGHQSCKGHASVALLPALLAEQGALVNRALDALLSDFVIGTEVALRAGLALHASVPDYHSSGAWNALGCAAIAARSRNLSVEKTWQALGIAEYYGPRAQMMRCIDHPTMVKDSSAWGALAGVSAADLAEDGFTGAPALTCENPELADIWGDLGETWRILEINFKVFPVCRWSHPVIEAIRSLKAKHGIAGKDVASIHVASFREAMRLDTRRPADSDAAQYSLPLAAALSLLEDNLTPETLHPSVYDRSEIWRLVDAVEVSSEESYDAIFPAERRCDVTLKLNNGQSVTLEGAEARGNFDDPLSDGDLLAKFETYASTCLQGDQRGQIAFILSDPSRAPTVQGLLNLIGKQ